MTRPARPSAVGLGRQAEAVAAGERAMALAPSGFDALESPAWES